MSMIEFLKCEICGHTAEKTLQCHINHAHNMKVKEYMDQFPNHSVFTEAIRESSRISNKNRDQSYRKKLSENTKRLYQNPDWVMKHNKALKESHNTPEAKEKHKQGAIFYYSNQTSEQKKKQKEACIKAWADPITRENRVKGLQRANNSDIVRQRHSKAMKKYLSIPGNLEKRNNILKETWAKPENRKKLNEITQIGLKAAMSPEGQKNRNLANQRPEVKKKRSEIAKKNISNLLKNRIKYSKLNEFLKLRMAENGLNPEKEYSLGPYCVDFCFPNNKLVIEADGDWWHANPEFMKEKNLTEFHPIQKKMIRLDKSKNTYLKNHGWIVLRFWERDIYKKIESCINIIKKTLQAG